ncbi:hypothetical protein GA0115257_111714, partial [Streptomyces sp. LcepLS]
YGRAALLDELAVEDGSARQVHGGVVMSGQAAVTSLPVRD